MFWIIGGVIVLGCWGFLRILSDEHGRRKAAAAAAEQARRAAADLAQAAATQTDKPARRAA